MPANSIVYKISPTVSNEELNALFEAAWPEQRASDFQPILTRSLLYVCGWQTEKLVGFVNLAWDGGLHAFLLDTTVHPQWQRQGIGQELVKQALQAATTHNIEWVHVDFEPHLRDFYAKCGFKPTEAGLVNLKTGK